MGQGRLAAIAVGLMLGLLSSARAEAAEISTGPVRIIAYGDTVACIAANTGATNIANVAVQVQFRTVNGTTAGDSFQACGTLSPLETCQVDTWGLTGDYAVFCEVTYPGGKRRATLCNTTRGLCSDAN